jgi:hypothetical protein
MARTPNSAPAQLVKQNWHAPLANRLAPVKVVVVGQSRRTAERRALLCQLTAVPLCRAMLCAPPSATHYAAEQAETGFTAHLHCAQGSPD